VKRGKEKRREEKEKERPPKAMPSLSTLRLLILGYLKL
jgi:hypothetical protein